MQRMYTAAKQERQGCGLGPSTIHETGLERCYLEPRTRSEKSFCSRAESRYSHSTAWGRIEPTGLCLNGILRPRGRVWMWVPAEAG